MERRSQDGAVALAAKRDEGGPLFGGAVASFSTLPSQAERSLALRLADELTDGPADARLRAASRLVDVAGERAVPLLAAAIEGAEPALRVALADALGRAGGEDAIDAVETLRRDAEPLVRAAAVDAAARLLEDVPLALCAVLRDALGDEDPKVRRRAALQAASARGIDPGELLAPVLSDDDRHARRLAAVALGTTRRPAAALALVDALLDDDASVRDAAAGSAALPFGAEALRIGTLAPLQRGRAVARLRAHVTANAGRLTGGLAPAAPADDIEIAATAAGDAEEAHLPLLDEAPAARPDHELDEDVLAVMHALSFARSLGQERARPAGDEEPADDVALEAAVADDDREDAPIDAAETDSADDAIDALAGDDDEGTIDDVASGANDERADVVAGEEEVARADVDAGDENDARADVDVELPPAARADDGGAAAEVSPAVDLATADSEFEAIEGIVRAALRGVTPEDLAAELGVSALALGPVLDDHLEAGRLVRRGKKLFLP